MIKSFKVEIEDDKIILRRFRADGQEVEPNKYSPEFLQSLLIGWRDAPHHSSIPENIMNDMESAIQLIRENNHA